MSHDTHAICANHYKLALDGKSPMQCCDCHPLEGCGDDVSSKWVDERLKAYRKEAEIARKQAKPEEYTDFEGFLKE